MAKVRTRAWTGFIRKKQEQYDKGLKASPSGHVKPGWMRIKT